MSSVRCTASKLKPRSDLRASDLERDYACLIEEASDSTAAFNIQVDGPDPLVETLLRAAGVRPNSTVVTRARHEGLRFTVVVATTGVWRDQMARLLSMRRAARKLNIRVLLVPAGRLRRPLFRENCRLVSRCRDIEITASDRAAVLDRVALDPHATLGDCAACVVASNDPVGAVLSLAASGAIAIDFNCHINGFSRVSSPTNRQCMPVDRLYAAAGMQLLARARS
ncbi:hypothetical protein ACFQI3_10355 [Hansschlegelia quercus]|uniref:Uncharacterized protein n=1 Tax=Hansschlegelia quercus TaxID=2528245 RepID=A0A4Q9GJX4_9HYPH|nr:hypothetical protein [Hansschlegelia quercus]TBN54462.1 hypothetical protein EYR15_06430 [Hansschlegelia quercus]